MKSSSVSLSAACSVDLLGSTLCEGLSKRLRYRDDAAGEPDDNRSSLSLLDKDDGWGCDCDCMWDPSSPWTGSLSTPSIWVERVEEKEDGEEDLRQERGGELSGCLEADERDDDNEAGFSDSVLSLLEVEEHGERACHRLDEEGDIVHPANTSGLLR